MVAQLLASIRTQSYPAIEVIIVDNGSIPPVSIPDPQVRLLRNDDNQGPCLAVNRGIANAHGELVILVNDDCELASTDTVQNAVALALQHPEAGAIGFSQLQPPSRQPSPTQAANTDTLSYAAWFYGYGCLLRKDLFDRIGGFDPVFVSYHEEVELSLRIMQAGMKILYAPGLQVVHYEDPRKRSFERIHRLTFKNALLTALLRYPWFCVPPAFASYLLNFFRMTRNKNGLDPAGVWWAAVEVFNQRGHIWSERRPLDFRTFQAMRALVKRPVPVDADGEALAARVA